jgi:HK97 family phage prohead protease
MYRTRKATTAPQQTTSQPPQPDGQQRGEPFGLKMRAAFKPGSINAEDRTVEVVFGSDKPVRMYTWEYGPINEELSFDASHVRMDRLNSGAPVLDNHDAYGSVLDTVVGVVEKAWSDGKKGYAKLRFAKTDKGDKMLEMARDGILQNVSVGYAVHKYMRSKSNEDGKLDNYRAVDWEPHEISMVAVPADADAKLRSLAGPDNSVTIEDENGKIETRSAEMYDAEMDDPKGQIETCTDAINELNEEIENSLAAAEAYPEQADLYAAVIAAHKAAISAHLEIIAAVNGQRSTNDIINQRKREMDFLKARF